jgi:hypothetical protein
MPNRWFWPLLITLVAAARLCHLDIVWVEEGYPLAAAREMLAGRTLYTGIWFDKPPLFPAAYLATLGHAGLPLRLFGIAWVLLAAWSCSWAARRAWGPAAAPWAAALCAFYLTFDTASAVMALTPDLMSIPLQALALGCAASGLPLHAGLAAGLAIGFNTKALLFLPAILLWQWRKPHLVLAGFALPAMALAIWLASSGALEAHWQQVWAWGFRYSADTPLSNPWLEGARRTLNWSGFHAPLFLALAPLRRHWRWIVAIAIGFAAAWLGLRFFPRYYFHALPPLILAAAAGLASMPRRRAWVCSLLLLVPFVRFGPRYAELAAETWRGQPHSWRDLAMFESSRQAARLLQAARIRHGGGLLVWGYRPELFALSGLPAGTPFLDSQPLNGVLADRHLLGSTPTFPEIAAANRARLLALPPPEWLADGLSPYNPALDPLQIPEMRYWSSRYRLVAESPGFRIYRLAH